MSSLHVLSVVRCLGDIGIDNRLGDEGIDDRLGDIGFDNRLSEDSERSGNLLVDCWSIIALSVLSISLVVLCCCCFCLGNVKSARKKKKAENVKHGAENPNTLKLNWSLSYTQQLPRRPQSFCQSIHDASNSAPNNRGPGTVPNTL